MAKPVNPNRVVVKKVDDEWQARVYINNKFNEDKTYFTDDKDDAEATARLMRKEMNLGGLGLPMQQKHMLLGAVSFALGAGSLALYQWWKKRSA